MLQEMSGAPAEAGAAQNSCLECKTKIQEKIRVNQTAMHMYNYSFRFAQAQNVMKCGTTKCDARARRLIFV